MSEKEKRHAVYLALAQLFFKLNVSLCEFDKLLREGLAQVIEVTLKL